jgi:uncharacterized protein (TIGR03437 family)
MRLPNPVLVLFFAFIVECWAQAPANPEPGPSQSSPTEIRTALWRGRMVHYVMRNGLPIYQGDIILDHLDPGPDPADVSSAQTQYAESSAATTPRPTPKGLGIIYPYSLWPPVGGIYQIPYITTNGTPNLKTAVAYYNQIFAGLIQWVPRTSETDYVNVYVDTTNTGGGGSSNIGRVGGEQLINCGTNCLVGAFLHEMGHATGLWHEQERPDHDKYVTIDYSHIRADSVAGLVTPSNDNWIYGPYDYASLMGGTVFGLTADGSQVMESLPVGIRLGVGTGAANSETNPAFYSTGDIDTIRRIYSAAPTYVTVDTNPTGLQVIVDGATVTTPQTYANWALSSQHTMAIPLGISNSGLQAQADALSQGVFYYQFARWNDGGQASHAITITPGSGLPGYQSTSPAQTIYTANFIQWAPFNFSASPVSPPGAGVPTTTPAPANFAGVGQLFISEQSVALTANAIPGYNFVQWYGYFWCDEMCPPTLFADPLNLSMFTTRDFGAYFTTSQVTTITTNPPGLMVQVDGKTYPSPARFSPDPNISGSNWAPGSEHTISATSPQNPWSPNTTYVWSNWSDGLATSHQITVPAGSSTVTANYNTAVGLVLVTNSSNNCAGSVVANPPGPSKTGSSVTFTATPHTGFVFAQWEGALSGSTNPSVGALDHEEFVQADFNIVPSPLIITSIFPPSASAGSQPFALTINGTGFALPAANGSAGAVAYVQYDNGLLGRPLTYVSPTQVQIPILAADIASPGAIQIIVENFNATGCWVVTTAHLPVSTTQAGPSPVLLQIKASHAGNFTQGQNGATYNLTISNATGAGPTRGTVTVTENVPSGLTLVSMTGTGWTCSGNSCTRGDVLNPGSSYPPITVTVNVASNAPSQVINQVSVSGGGSAVDDNGDPTTINAQITMTWVGNAAESAQATPGVVAPGSYVAIYGTGLAATGTAAATSLPLPTTLNGVQFLLGGLPMPLLYASATQVNALVPQGLGPNATYPLVVVRGTTQSAPVPLTVTELQPGIYTVDGSGSGKGIVTNALTGQLNTASSPAHAGDYLTIFCTGLGAVAGPNGVAGPGDGAVAASDPSMIFQTKATVTVTIGGIPAPVLFSGLAPGFAALYQVNVQVPSGAPTSGDVTLTVTATDAQTGSSAQSNAVNLAVE